MADSPRSPIIDHTLVSTLYPDSHADAVWREVLASSSDYRYVRKDAWGTDESLPAEWFVDPIFEWRPGKRSVDLVFEWQGALLRVDADKNGGLTVFVAAAGRAKGEEVLAAVRALLPKRKRSADDRIDVGFWYLAPHGPVRKERKIVAPTWDEITENYGARTRRHLVEAMRNFRPSHGGQIILWHGQPGTGKTWALRALCREWREWCSAEYIVDPDNAFGSEPAYLMELILNDGEDRPAPAGGKDEDAEPPWKLLILEDTGELIGERAKVEAGQGLSRLLNVADGFLGQGLRVLVLITTNEEIGKLHPAVSRPGRAASVVLFDLLTSGEARSWLQARGMEPVVSQTQTLADLYARAEAFSERETGRPRIGFVQDVAV